MVYQVYLTSSIKGRQWEGSKEIGRVGHAHLIFSSVLNKRWTSILAPGMNQIRH